MSKKDRFVNLCSHSIEVKDMYGKVRTFDPSGDECRVGTHPKDVTYHDGVEIFTEVYGDVENLPAAKEGVMYIVSAKVTNALNGSRKDVVSPGRQVNFTGSKKVKYSLGLRRKF